MMERLILTVGFGTYIIKNILVNDNLYESIRLSSEVSGFQIQASYHLF